MQILIAGGTGFLGSYLTRRFLNLGYQVSIVSRMPGHVGWTDDELVSAIEQADVIINLAGHSINCRHHARNRAMILESRLDAVDKLGKALLKASHLPKLFINASASAFYESTNVRVQTEYDYSPGTGFLADTVRLWEYHFQSCGLSSVRQVMLRTSVVLGNGGGAFVPLHKLARLGLGGSVGSGNQMFSWIHVDDYFNAVLFCIENVNIQGPINITSPSPLAQKQFMAKFRKVVGVPIGLPAPEFAVRMGAYLLGTEADLLLAPVNMYPQKLLDNGFIFSYPDIESALANLVRNLK